MYGVLGLATVALLLVFVPWILLCRTVGLPAHKAARMCIWAYGRACAVGARPAVAVRVNDPAALCGIPPAIVVANHQSFFDTYLLGAQDKGDVGMLIKSWPFRKLFFFRPLMRMAGYIETGTGSPGDILAQCREDLASGGHLMGFPEGTRSEGGELGRFYSGLFMLAMETGAKVVPMVIHDSFRVLPKGSRLFRPGTVHVDFLEPVDPARFANEQIPHGALRRHVRALMAECMEKRKNGDA